jgi:hypothetical protein
MRASAISTLLVIALASCGSDGVSPQPLLVASTLEIVSGNEQRGPAGAPLPEDLVVRMRDQDRQPLAGTEVTWEVTGGGGSLNAMTSTTDAQGLARTRLTLGSAVGQNGARARLGNSVAPVEFTATAVAGAPAMAMVTPGTATLIALDDTVRFRAAVTDQFGNVLQDAQITWSSTGEAATMDGGGLAQARGNGEARIRATAGGSTGEAVLQVAQAPASVGVTPAEAEIEVGAEQQLTAAVRDRNGHAIAQAPVEWSSSVPSIAEVSAAGRVTGRAEDQATISARSGDALGQAMLRVLRPVPNCAEVRTFGNGQTLSGELPSVQITGNVTVAGPTSVCGDLLIGTSGRLNLSGQEVAVAGNLATASNGRLQMQDTADRLVVRGNALFQGTSFQGDLSAGTLEIAGNLSTMQADFNVLATAAHRVILNGTAAQTVDMKIGTLTSSSNQLRHLEVRNSAGVSFTSNAGNTGELDLLRQMIVPAGVTLSRIQMLFLRGTSVLTNNGTIQTAACTKEPGHTINGTDPCP